MFKKFLCISIVLGYSSMSLATNQHAQSVPADYFDMTNWKITLPIDMDNNGKVDEIEGKDILSYSHPQFFFLNENKHLVFEVANNSITTSGSSNARSELRQMIRGLDKSIGTKSPKNNFSLAAHNNAAQFGSTGGKLEATLKVNHVSTHSKYPTKYPAFSVVVGQIHADKDDKLIAAKTGFGYGNEPLKIFYKKFPDQKTGSVYWTYERNLEKDNPDRMDIAYPVWGNTWENASDPKESGIALGEEFSYSVSVDGNIMHLTFTSANHKEVKYSVDLSTNIDPNGKVDPLDNPHGYAQDSHYFKAGAYGQCSVKDDKGFWSTACAGTGDFDVDKANGDYNSVTFSKLELTKVAPKKM
jgi:poly(beta-D-mannuronate) lyase